MDSHIVCIGNEVKKVVPAVRNLSMCKHLFKYAFIQSKYRKIGNYIDIGIIDNNPACIFVSKEKAEIGIARLNFEATKGSINLTTVDNTSMSGLLAFIHHIIYQAPAMNADS